MRTAQGATPAPHASPANLPEHFLLILIVPTRAKLSAAVVPSFKKSSLSLPPGQFLSQVPVSVEGSVTASKDSPQGSHLSEHLWVLFWCLGLLGFYLILRTWWWRFRQDARLKEYWVWGCARLGMFLAEGGCLTVGCAQLRGAWLCGVPG